MGLIPLFTTHDQSGMAQKLNTLKTQSPELNIILYFLKGLDLSTNSKKQSKLLV